MLYVREIYIVPWLQGEGLLHACFLVPEPTARSAVPGVSPGRGLLIPLGYLHPGKCEHSEVQSHPPCHGRTTIEIIKE